MRQYLTASPVVFTRTGGELVNLALRFEDPAKLYARRSEDELRDDRTTVLGSIDWRSNYLKSKGRTVDEIRADPETIQAMDELRAINQRLDAFESERAHKTRQESFWRTAQNALRGQLNLFGANRF